MRLWQDHSLTIVLIGSGAALAALSFAFEGKVFDLFLGLGTGLVTVAAVNGLSGPLVERNKPEEEQ